MGVQTSSAGGSVYKCWINDPAWDGVFPPGWLPDNEYPPDLTPNDDELPYESSSSSSSSSIKKQVKSFRSKY